jgi:magnesium-transporting ATPase (P-type)
MKLTSLLDKCLVSVDLKSHTAEEAIAEIIDYIEVARKIKHKEEILQKVLERERSQSTGLGGGVAIPHARIEGLKEPLIFVGIARHGIDFGSPDGRPVHLIILFITPLAESETHLKILSQISSMVQNKGLVERILSAGSREELCHTLGLEEVQRQGFLNLTRDEIFRELGTTEQGLSEEDAKGHLEKYGHNILKKIMKTPLIVRLLYNFSNLLAILMWVGSALSFFVGMPEVGWAIIAVIFLNGIFAFWQEFKAEKAIEALKHLIPSYARVIRDGEEKRVLSSDVVPGDVAIFEEGDNIPADGRLIEAHELRVDNSVFSGESRPGYKMAEPFYDGKNFIWTEMPNLIFAGTSVVSGNGKAVIIATGMNTEVGRIAYLTQTVKEELSPLQKQINRLTKVITLLAIGGGLVFFLVGKLTAGMTIMASAIFAIGIIIANVPEGLLPTITLSLAVAVQRMARRHALMKKLSSVETLGSTNVVCTDKTGTLTENRITVTKIWLSGKVIEVTGSGYEPKGDFLLQASASSIDLQSSASSIAAASGGIVSSVSRASSIKGFSTKASLIRGSSANVSSTKIYSTNIYSATASSANISSTKVYSTTASSSKASSTNAPSMVADESPESLQWSLTDKRKDLNLMMMTSILCNTSKLVQPTEAQRYWSIIGDPTEGALLVLAAKAGFDSEKERKNFPLVKRFPFESVRKRMSSINQMEDGSMLALVKGAPREVLDLSSRILLGQDIVYLSATQRAEIDAQIDSFARDGLRVLAIAYRSITSAEAADATSETVERNLTFIGITAMHDPPRPEVRESIALCRRAGIRVVMITGDYGITAQAIARQVGMITSESAEVITGPELSMMSDEELRERIGHEVIFARVNPEHKLRVVSAFKDLGNVVAVTGDGVNDAPALKRADIGIAMGIRGTDVAKEAAEMILTDDNFASIVAAIEEGRAVFDNAKKFITYIIAHLVPEAVPFIFYALLKIPVPITVMQILAIDLGTETLPALALGTEKPEPGIMDLPPRSQKKGIIDAMVIFRGYIFLGLLASAAVVISYFLVLRAGGWKLGMQLEPDDTIFTNLLHLKAITMVFAGIVVIQIANVFACRSEKHSAFRIGLFSNKLILWGIGFEVIFVAALVYVPPLQRIFNTIGLGLKDWGLLSIFMVIIFGLEELRKKMARAWKS